MAPFCGCSPMHIYDCSHVITTLGGCSTNAMLIHRDQLNSRFHGRDIFREIDLLP